MAPTTTHTYTINVYGRHSGQDHTYTVHERREAYATRDFWIREGYTALLTSPLIPR